MESGVLGDLCGVAGGVAGTTVGPGMSGTGGVLVDVRESCFGDSGSGTWGLTSPDGGGWKSDVGPGPGVGVCFE